ncbi:hypothetical protein EV174_005358 [Coemansia sp. RSA 2320]|nr:hypothetical protein EV174_005358 [Coemansia sp. RSA 2320]
MSSSTTDAIYVFSDSDLDADDLFILDSPDPQPHSQDFSGGVKRKLASTNDSQRDTALRQRHSGGELAFPDGIVRLTRMTGGKANVSEAVTLTDIIQPNLVRKALLSTFVLDIDWLLAHFNSSTRIVVVKSYNPKVERRGVYQSHNGRVTLVNPEFTDKQAYPIMHSKIMLLFYDDYVRFVVSSANLFDVDWTMLQNIVFMQDLPYTPSTVHASTEFGTTLAESLRDLSVPEAVVEQLRHIDFSCVKAHIVTSVPSSPGRSKYHSTSYGQARLSKIVQRINDSANVDAKEKYSATLYCYGSSMGRLTNAYLRSFYASALGTSLASVQGKGGLAPGDIEKRIKVGFHTSAQTASNAHGPTPCECIKFSSQYYADRTFPKYALYKIEPMVPSTLVHAKVILSRFNPKEGQPQTRGWMYLGSHNFTPGAWGHLKSYGSGIYVNNYEYGIILPDVQFESVFGRDSVTWNGLKVPLPFKLTWQKYESGDQPHLS